MNTWSYYLKWLHFGHSRPKKPLRTTGLGYFVGQILFLLLNQHCQSNEDKQTNKQTNKQQIEEFKVSVTQSIN